MRKWIEMLESLRPMEPRDYSVYSGKTIDNDSSSIDIQGDDVSGLSTEQAKSYLDKHPNGTLHNDIFDSESFITLDRNGQYLFYHGVDEKIMSWEWSEVDEMIENDQDREWLDDWWYHPGDQMEVTNGGFKWWSDLRSGKYSKVKPQLESEEPTHLVLGNGMMTIPMNGSKAEDDDHHEPKVIKLGSKRSSTAAQRFMDEFIASTEEHPFTRGMRYFPDGPVLVKIIVSGQYDDEVDLEDIQSKAKGAGAKALRVICSIADNTDVTIALYAQGYAHVPTEKLIEYYERFGFRVRNPADDHEDGVDMVRYPL